MEKDSLLYEKLSFNTHPCLCEEVYDGWLLRFAKGYTKRANSVSVVGTSDVPYVDKIIYVPTGNNYNKPGLLDGKHRIEMLEIMLKDINLKIANALSYMLKSSGVDVIQTRTDDSSTESNSNSTISSRKKSDLRNRLQIVKSNPDAILVSIHLNKFSSPSAKGAQIFYAPSADNSNILAESIRRNITSLIQKDNSRALKKATKDVYLLYNSTIPAVIVECGFMSNPEDFKNLQAEDYQNRMAFAIFGGILSYLSKS